MPTITLTFNTADELDTELRGLLETIYQHEDIDTESCLDQYLATCEEFELALDARVVGAFFNQNTDQYVANSPYPHDEP